jgi:hypothetical protein
MDHIKNTSPKSSSIVATGGYHMDHVFEFLNLNLFTFYTEHHSCIAVYGHYLTMAVVHDHYLVTYLYATI